MLENHFSTGLPDLDSMIGHLGPKRLVVVSGISQSGMTTMLLSLARAAAGKNVPTRFVDLEAGVRIVRLRMLAGIAEVDHLCIQRGQLNDVERAHVQYARSWMDSAMLRIVGYGEVHTLEQLREEASLYPRPRLILIDAARYLVRSERRQADLINELAVGLKHMAGALNGCVVVSHPLRHTEESERNPSINDLGEAYPLANHADQVVLIHRPELYADRSRPGEVELRVVKNRQGPAAVVPVVAQLRFSRFVPLEQPGSQAA